MTKEFVPYELAVKLKQLGFNEPCFFAFDNCSHPMRCSDLRTNEQKFDGVNYNSSSYTSQPTFSQAFRWFREKHQLDTSINTVYSKYNDALSKKYSGVIDDKSVFTNIGFYDAYEEAELACLDKLIEIVTKQQEQ
jgi:hypothetical protein